MSQVGHAHCTYHYKSLRSPAKGEMTHLYLTLASQIRGLACVETCGSPRSAWVHGFIRFPVGRHLGVGEVKKYHAALTPARMMDDHGDRFHLVM